MNLPIFSVSKDVRDRELDRLCPRIDTKDILLIKLTCSVPQAVSRVSLEHPDVLSLVESRYLTAYERHPTEGVLLAITDDGIRYLRMLRLEQPLGLTENQYQIALANRDIINRFIDEPTSPMWFDVYRDSADRPLP